MKCTAPWYELNISAPDNVVSACCYYAGDKEPWHDEPSLRVARGIWNPVTGEYVWTAVPLRFIAKGSISVVEEARGLDDAVAPLLREESDAEAT